MTSLNNARCAMPFTTSLSLLPWSTCPLLSPSCDMVTSVPRYPGSISFYTPSHSTTFLSLISSHSLLQPPPPGQPPRSDTFSNSVINPSLCQVPSMDGCYPISLPVFPPSALPAVLPPSTYSHELQAVQEHCKALELELARVAAECETLCTCWTQIAHFSAQAITPHPLPPMASKQRPTYKHTQTSSSGTGQTFYSGQRYLL